MKIYHYREPVIDSSIVPVPVTGEYLGSGFADPDPREEGSWIIPAYATTVEPPTIPDGKIAVWSGSSWSLEVRPEPPPPPEPEPEPEPENTPPA